MLSRKNTAERTAAQAWDYLSSAMAGAGESAKDAGKHTADLAGTKAAAATATATKFADKAGAKLNRVSDEALVRATLAANALAGRKPGLPWGLIAGAGLVGIALGWVCAATARAAMERRAENEQLELAETDPAGVVTPSYGS